MGGSRWHDSAYNDIKSRYAGKSRDSIFTQSRVAKGHNDMSPYELKIRECRDNPDTGEAAVPVLMFLDETASMGRIPDEMVRNSLGTQMGILQQHGINNPSICFCGIGDHYSDRYPLQVGQFESSPELVVQWLEKMYLEGGGGGQWMESYSLAWLIAGRHTSLDHFEKRNKKGYLFTIGDEGFHTILEKEAVNKLFGEDYSSEDIDSRSLLKEAQRMYHVFHIHCIDGSPLRPHQEEKWTDTMGEKYLKVNSRDIPEIVGTTVSVMEGADLNTVVKSMSKSKALIVSNALAHINADVSNDGNTNGIVEL